MKFRHLAILLAIALPMVGCATSQQAKEKPQPAPVKEAAGSLAPPEYLSPPVAVPAFSGKTDSPFNQGLAIFLLETGLVQGVSLEAAEGVTASLNGPVESYLKSFSGSQRSAFAGTLARSGRFLPMMRKVFKEHGLPQELVYLALVESGYDPFAKSPKEAMGLWQFMEETGRRYGLVIDPEVDERRDPEKSTRAAARYLKDLHRQFGCWFLAAAAYNAGEGRVAAALQRHTGRDFWGLAAKGLLPKETCNFVPQWVAAAYIARDPKQFGFGKITLHRPWGGDRVKVPGGVDLNRFADVLGIPFQDLQALNPELNTDLTPLTRKDYALRVPGAKRQEARKLAQELWQGGPLLTQAAK